MNNKMQTSAWMCSELDVAGNFIYQGIETYNKIDNLYSSTDIFFSLYHLSVGIERVQKVILTLYDDIKEVHDHQILHQMIIKHIKKNNLNKNEGKFLEIISQFYKNCRYNRFELNNELSREKTLLLEFINKNCKNKKIDFNLKDFCFIKNENEFKQFLSKIVYEISAKYYKVIYNRCRELGIFSYELESNSVASFVFNEYYQKSNNQRTYNLEKNAIKELLIYILNLKETNEFLEILKKIKPIALDIADFQDYFIGLCNNKNCNLVETIEALYEQLDLTPSELQEREELLELVGNKYLYFDDETEDDE